MVREENYLMFYSESVITHGHLDYIRGLVRGNKPTFSNAVVYLKKEHEF